MKSVNPFLAVYKRVSKSILRFIGPESVSISEKIPEAVRKSILKVKGDLRKVASAHGIEIRVRPSKIEGIVDVRINQFKPSLVLEEPPALSNAGTMSDNYSLYYPQLTKTTRHPVGISPQNPQIFLENVRRLTTQPAIGYTRI